MSSTVSFSHAPLFRRSTGAGLVPLAPSTIWRLALIMPSWIVQDRLVACAAEPSRVLSPRATGPLIFARRARIFHRSASILLYCMHTCVLRKRL